MISTATVENLADINQICAAITADRSNDHTLHGYFTSEIGLTTDQATFIFTRDESTVGFLRLHQYQSSECIFETFVLPQFQSQGIGTELIRYCIEYVRMNMTYRRIHLAVLHSNTRAFDLYKREGFETYDQDIKGKYMRLELNRQC